MRYLLYIFAVIIFACNAYADEITDRATAIRKLDLVREYYLSRGDIDNSNRAAMSEVMAIEGVIAKYGSEAIREKFGSRIPGRGKLLQGQFLVFIGGGPDSADGDGLWSLLKGQSRAYQANSQAQPTEQPHSGGAACINLGGGIVDCQSASGGGGVACVDLGGGIVHCQPH